MKTLTTCEPTYSTGDHLSPYTVDDGTYRIQRLMDSLFFPTTPQQYISVVTASEKIPRINAMVKKDGTEFIIEAAIAGYGNDVEVKIDGQKIIMSGGSSTEKDSEYEYVLKELTSKSFTRTVAIPPSVDKKNIKVTKDQGILRITMPVLEEERPRILQIENN